MYTLLAGLVFAATNLLFFIALEVGPVSIVSPISSTYPLIATILSHHLFPCQSLRAAGTGYYSYRGRRDGSIGLLSLEKVASLI